MTTVRIIDTDPIRRDNHPVGVIVCHTDDIAEAMQNGGWFDMAPIETRDAIHALQTAVTAGACTDSLERLLGVTVQSVSDASGTVTR